jgi:archaea-specific DNA-binding protein
MWSNNRKKQSNNMKENTEDSVLKGDVGNNFVFVGSKPLVNYIRGVIMQFTKKGVQEVVIKSRGKFISKAVDVAEITRRSLEEAAYVKDIKIGSETFEGEGKRTNVSTMDITLAKR